MILGSSVWIFGWHTPIVCPQDMVFHFPNWKGTSVILDIGLTMVCLWSMLSGSHCSGRKLGPWRKQSTWPQQKPCWRCEHCITQDTLSACVCLQSWKLNRKEEGGVRRWCLKTTHWSACVLPFPHSRNGVNMATTVHRTPDISSSSSSLLSHEVSSLGPACESFVVCCLPPSGPTATGPIRHGWEPPKLPAKINLFSP